MVRAYDTDKSRSISLYVIMDFIASSAVVLTSTNTVLTSTKMAIDIINRSKTETPKSIEDDKRKRRNINTLNTTNEKKASDGQVDEEQSIENDRYNTKDNSFRHIVHRQIGPDGLLYIISFSVICFVVIFIIIGIFITLCLFYNAKNTNVLNEKIKDVISFN